MEDEGGNRDQHPAICEYKFCVDISGLVNKLDSMGSNVKWPHKNSIPAIRRDQTKFCQFHDDIGHNTEDCIALRREVAWLLKQGHLKDLFPKRNSD